MTKLTATHRSSNEAVIEVCKILNEAGALSEVIKNDYGEDIWVQTQLNDFADSFNILIQVKARTLKRNSESRFSLRLNTNHLRRWVSHLQPILVCVYDTTTKYTYSFSPQDMFSMWELTNSEKSTITIKLDEDLVFNKDTAKTFIWRCRISYYSKSLAWNQHIINDIKRHDINNDRIEHLNREIITILLFFLKDVGAIQSDGMLNSRYLDYLINACKNFSQDENKDLDLYDACHLSFLGFVDDITGSGLPSNLLFGGTKMIMDIMLDNHKSEWDRAAKIIKRKV